MTNEQRAAIREEYGDFPGGGPYEVPWTFAACIGADVDELRLYMLHLLDQRGIVIEELEL